MKSPTAAKIAVPSDTAQPAADTVISFTTTDRVPSRPPPPLVTTMAMMPPSSATNAAPARSRGLPERFSRWFPGVRVISASVVRAARSANGGLARQDVFPVEILARR